MSNDFPFTLRDVAYLCGISTDFTKENEYITCPFCGRKKKMNLKYSTGQYNCPACGEGGHMLRLYAKLNGMEDKTNAEITFAIKKELGITDSFASTVYKNSVNVNITKVKKQIVRASIDESKRIDKIYRDFLDKLSLSEMHYKNLINRGLNDRDIQKWKFKSVPMFGYKRIAEELIDKGHDLNGVGGFYKDADRWTVNINSKMTGIIIPAWNIDGLIEGLQIRLDVPFGKCKYLWISSAGKCSGTGTKATPFFAKGLRRNDTLVITEGAFKAIIPSKIFGYSVLGIPGVNNQTEIKKIIPQIKKMGYKKIVEAFDADFRFNENVKSAKTKLKEMMESFGFEYDTFVWDYSKGKGLDDFAVNSLKETKTA